MEDKLIRDTKSLLPCFLVFLPAAHAAGTLPNDHGVNGCIESEQKQEDHHGGVINDMRHYYGNSGASTFHSYKSTISFWFEK